MDRIKYEIDINKYTFLKNVSEKDSLVLNSVIDEIFNLGYHHYIKSLITITNTTLAISTNTKVESEINNITDNKTTSKGQLGENVVYDILVEKFPDYQIDNMSKIPHSGDIQVEIASKNKIIVEVKNYNKTIDQEQIDKLKFDMKYSNIYYSIFISLNSGIVGRKRFELETFYFNKQNYVILYIPYAMHKSIPSKKYMISHNSIDESVSNLTFKVEFSICIMTSIADKFSKPYFNRLQYEQTKNLDHLIDEFNKFYDEYRVIKNSAVKMEDNIKKSLESHVSVIKDYENNIKNNINKLISKKIKVSNEEIVEIYKIDKENDINKIIIKKYSNNNWNILINNILYGKILLINKKYDLLFVLNNTIIQEEYDNFESCEKILYNL
jgi:hypothetical protein